MPLVPLEIPPGVYRNGTEYEAKGRWFDTSLIRWREGRLEPIGGWLKADDTQLDGKCRGLLAWRANNAERYVAAGTNTKLYASQGGQYYDITPSGFTTGKADSQPGLGWGTATYGIGDYGVSRPSNELIDAATWSMDNWGEYLIACSTADGKIYEWQLDVESDAAVVANAPEDNVGIIVTNERYLVALGAGGNKRKVQWSDQEDNTTWTPLATNTAGDLELETNGQISCARRVGNDILIWTDSDVHLMRYLGPPFVYGIERIGVGSGIVGPRAVAVTGNTAVWLSESGFWVYNGSIQPLKCEALLDVTERLNRDQQVKVYGGHNSEFGEAWFFYPSSDSIENDKYIAWDYLQNHWVVGNLARTAWVDQGALSEPLAAGADGYIYEHETGWTNDEATRVGDVYAETGPIEVGQGDRFAVINRIIADEYDTLPSVRATISYKNTPQLTEASKQYVFNQADGYIDTRINARQLKIKLEATQDDGFKFGTLRMDIKQGSGR